MEIFSSRHLAGEGIPSTVINDFSPVGDLKEKLDPLLFFSFLFPARGRALL